MKIVIIFGSKLDGFSGRLFDWLDDNLLSQELWKIIPLPKRMRKAILRRRLIEADLDNTYLQLFDREKLSVTFVQVKRQP